MSPTRTAIPFEEARRREDAKRRFKGAPSATGEPSEPSPGWAGPEGDAKPGSPPTLVWHGDAEPKPPPYLIDGVLPEKQIAILGGQSGAGKTFIAVDIAVAAMTGEPFCGHEVRRHGGVLWLAAEGQSEVAIRLKAAIVHRCGENDPGTLPFAQQAFEVPTLTAEDALARLAALVDAAKSGLAARFPGVELVLIVIDTLNSAAGFQDENSASEAQKVMTTLRRLSDASGALILVVDHYGKAVETGVRGSSAKTGAADAILAALADRNTEGEVSNRRMAVVKLRSAPTGGVTSFKLNSVPVDQCGNTHCGVEWTLLPEGSIAPKGDKPAWTGHARVLKSAIERAMLDHGQDVRPWGAAEKPRRAVTYEKVRAEFYSLYAADRQETKKKAFQRLVPQALAKTLIAASEIAGTDWLWIVKEDANDNRDT